jgi:hypothetical protein
LMALAAVATVAVSAAAPAHAQRGWGWGPGVAAGVVGGAIIGGALAGPGYYGPGYYGPGYGYGGRAYVADDYYGGCVWQRQRFWDGYGWRVRRVRVCGGSLRSPRLARDVMYSRGALSGAARKRPLFQPSRLTNF